MVEVLRGGVRLLFDDRPKWKQGMQGDDLTGHIIDVVLGKEKNSKRPLRRLYYRTENMERIEEKSIIDYTSWRLKSLNVTISINTTTTF